MAPIDLYWTLLSPPARATAATAKHLGIDVNLINVNLMAGDTHKPEYLKMNPSHTVPTINDNGFALFESRAIMVYLVEKYASGNAIYPDDVQTRAKMNQVLYFDAAALSQATRTIVFSRLFQKAEPPQSAWDELKDKINTLTQLLGEQKFFTGDRVTLADISLGTSIHYCKFLAPDLVGDKFDTWLERVHAAVPALKYYNDQVDYSSFAKILNEGKK